MALSMASVVCVWIRIRIKDEKCNNRFSSLAQCHCAFISGWMPCVGLAER